MIFVDDKQQKHDESTKSHATNIRITSTTRHQKCFSTSNTKVKARTTLPWSREAIRAAWRLLGWNPKIRGGDAPRVVVLRDVMMPFFMNNKGYIFIVRRLGKQSKLFMSRSDSISNLKLNLRIHGLCGPDAHAGADLQVFLIFCFKPILLSAHKLPLLIYGDNSMVTLQLVVISFNKILPRLKANAVESANLRAS